MLPKQSSQTALSRMFLDAHYKGRSKKLVLKSFGRASVLYSGGEESMETNFGGATVSVTVFLATPMNE